MKTVNYVVIKDTKKYLTIKDVGPWDVHLTVTNGAEIVVEELVRDLRGRDLYYIDSAGQTDQLLIQDGEFAGFRAGGPDGQR